MAESLCERLRTGTPLPANHLAEREAAVQSLTKHRNGDVARLAELAVAWVRLNPQPASFAKPAYSR